MNLKSLKSRLPNLKSAVFYIAGTIGLTSLLLAGCAELSDISGELSPGSLYSEAKKEQEDSYENFSEGFDQEGELFAELYNPYTGEILNIPQYAGEPLIEINGGKPFFTEEELSMAEDKRGEPFEYYSELDELGRCGAAFARLSEELLPTKARGDIHSVKPTGWHSVRFPFIDGESVYNRCHLIAHSLTGEDDNEKNLITGTRYMNAEGMLPIEEELRDQVYQGDESIIYRVTPCFYEDELVARGVLIEAYSGADRGASAELCYFAYNVQPGIDIDYETGYVDLSDEVLYAGDADDSIFGSPDHDDGSYDERYDSYILNISSRKFHEPDCIGVEDIKDKSKKAFVGERKVLILNEFNPCGICRP